MGRRTWCSRSHNSLQHSPANVLFPIAVVAIVQLALNPNIWLSPLMVLGTQWYILFNVIAGASVRSRPIYARSPATLYRLCSLPAVVAQGNRYAWHPALLRDRRDDRDRRIMECQHRCGSRDLGTN